MLKPLCLLDSVFCLSHKLKAPKRNTVSGFPKGTLLRLFRDDFLTYYLKKKKIILIYLHKNSHFKMIIT